MKWMNISKRLLVIIFTLFLGINVYATELLELDSTLYSMISDTPYSGTFHNVGAIDDTEYRDYGKGMAYLSQMTGIHVYFLHPMYEHGFAKSEMEAQQEIQRLMDTTIEEASAYDKYVIYISDTSFRKHHFEEPGYDLLDSNEKHTVFYTDAQLYTSGLSFKEEQVVNDTFSENIRYRLAKFVNYLRVGPELYESMQYSASDNDAFVLAANFLYYEHDINYWNIITEFSEYRADETIVKLFSDSSVNKHFGISDYEKVVEQVSSNDDDDFDFGVFLVGLIAMLIPPAFIIGIIVFIVKLFKSGKSKKMEAVEIKAREVEIEHRKADLRMKENEIERQKAENVATILKAPLSIMTSTNDDDLEDEYGTTKITASYVEENEENDLLILQWYKDLNYNGFNKDKYTVKAMEEIFNIALVNKLIPREKHHSHYEDFKEWLESQGGH